MKTLKFQVECVNAQDHRLLALGLFVDERISEEDKRSICSNYGRSKFFNIYEIEDSSRYYVMGVDDKLDNCISVLDFYKNGNLPLA